MSHEPLSSDQCLILNCEGFLVTSSGIAPERINDLRVHCERILATSSKGRVAGVRNLLHHDDVLTVLATSGVMADTASAVLGTSAVAVRLIVFDKTESANWAVPWHQDLNIAVRGRIADPDYGPWSVKEGVPHVVPPRGVLEKMITLRLHLDDCSRSTGALRVAPGTHRAGIVREIEVNAEALSTLAVDCLASAGDFVLIRPLLFHSSGKATRVARRRVIHVEYAAVGALPAELEWYFSQATPTIGSPHES